MDYSKYLSERAKPLKASAIREMFKLMADPEIISLAGGAGTSRGTGGMATKLDAALLTTSAGCDMIIANGSKPELLYDIVSGKKVGTKFLKKG